MNRIPFRRDPWLLLILWLAFGLRTYHLAYPPWDYHNWRQTMTLMVARDFARHDFPLLHPKLMWMSQNRPADPSYFSGEFSIESIVTALLYKLFGESDTIARLVVIAFSLAGIYFLYELLNRRSGPRAARLGAIIYALLPYHVFFGRVFMPDVPALTLALGGLATLDRWADTRQRRTLVAAAVLTALAILQKLTVIFVALPALYVFWLVYGRRVMTRVEPYLFAVIAALPALLWYTHSAGMARQSGFAIMQPFLFGRHLSHWLQLPFLYEMGKALASEALSPIGLGLAIIGLIFLPVRDRAASLFRLWVAGAIGLLFFIPTALPENHYYLSLLLPGAAALAGLTLARLPADRTGHAVLIVILSLFTASAIASALPLYQPDRSPYDLGTLLKNLTRPADQIVTESGGSPNILYYADRRGWMLNRTYDVAIVERLAKSGALYYADTFASDTSDQPGFFHALNTRFERLTADDAVWSIYNLSAPESPGELPSNEIQTAFAVSFGDQLEFRGTSLRQLLAWPSVYEVTYYWKFLKQPAANFRLLVHITNAAGQTVYRQDRQPRTNSKWNAGDIVRDRSVLLLPTSLPEGKYQIQLGWSDSSGARRQENGLRVAQIEVRKPPRYGWLTAK
ncbi:MAG: family glycosyltransferase, 4-amino-4-deoxy-L-arabinose transferase [Bryobacterales bacterium]|nr:family glycosyltransferase, 4-amino-4-deoxy-L-arabinose transferase [Bryobacterales bacterium]